MRFSVGYGASAVLNEYVSVLETRTPLPDGRAQRRDQYVARKCKLDGSTPVNAIFGAVWRKY